MENNKKASAILVQGAMDIEINILLESLNKVKEIRSGSWSFWCGEISDYPVIISRTDMGMVNAAAASISAILQFKPAIIINQGTAGGHIAQLNVGDIVVAEYSVNIGAFQTPVTTQNNGIHPQHWQTFSPVMYLRNNDDSEQQNNSYPSDKKLVNLAMSIAPLYAKGKVIKGTLGSSDSWNREVDRILWLANKYQTVAEEMESVAVAQIAKAYQIPFIGIRVITNNEIKQQEYTPQVANDCQKFVLNYLNALIKQMAV